MAIDPARVKALFQAAIEHDDPAARRAWLDREVGDDAELRGRLDHLLAAFDRPPEVLERPLGADPEATAAVDPEVTSDVVRTASPEPGPTVADKPTVDLAAAGPGVAVDTVIAGRYKIRQAIGEGGMGTVYLAEQLKPVRRQVALKLIKPGMDSRQVLARFESERQALALMDHPNIARVLDAGSTDDSRPFFVMELVKGIALTEYCDNHRLDLPSRLGLFRQICSAVQHAHQKGIIHRDLKPTNILVESHDGRPVPKVIDFGLAKATSGMQLSEHSLFTAFGSVTGTPLYMAPEQATFNALDVDTRADIYALGVILYELLSGSTPIQRDTMKRAALDEMLRVIREVEPPTPSSRISTSEGLPSLAANRHVEPARLSRLVKGDLDWIVMKALAKERERRYDSAIGMANDVERFLNHEPVSAGPPTAAYRLRKFVRRNRGRVAAAALVLLALVGGVAGTAIGLVEARRQEREARKQEAIARDESSAKEQARKAEAEQRRVAEGRLAQVAKMNAILGSIFENLDPKRADRDGKPLGAVLGERLERAAAEIEGEATGDPMAVARMQMTLGNSLHSLGYEPKAIELFSKARATFAARLGPDHPDTLTSLAFLGASHAAAGRHAEAIKLYGEALALRKARLGPDHPHTLGSMISLAACYFSVGRRAEALKLAEETLALQKARLGPDHPDTLGSMISLAAAAADAGRGNEAFKLHEETLAQQKARLGPDHPDTLWSMSNLAVGYSKAGRHSEALKLHEETLALRKAKFGPDHPDTLTSMSNLAASYFDVGRRVEGLKLAEETLTVRRARLGPDHPDTLASMSILAKFYSAAGRRDEGLKLEEETLALRRVRLGPDHPSTLASMNDVAVGYAKAGRRAEALKLGEETLAQQKARLGPDHPDTLRSMGNLASFYVKAGRRAEALKLGEETLALQRARLGPDHPYTLLTMSNLATSYRDSGRRAEALKLDEETLALRRAKLGPDHPDTLTSMKHLAQGYQDGGAFDRAEPLRDELVVARRKAGGEGHPDTLAARLDRADLDLVRKRYDVAEPAYRAILAECLARLGPDHAVTVWAVNSLATLYERRGDWAEVVPLRRADLERARKAPGDRVALGAALAMLGRALLEAKQWPEAEPVCREALEIREADAPDLWTTFNTRSMLGGSLLGQGKIAEAEPLLRSGYEGMKARAGTILPIGKPRLAEALDRLIAFGEATGKADEAAAWKAERAKLAAEAPKPGGK